VHRSSSNSKLRSVLIAIGVFAVVALLGEAAGNLARNSVIHITSWVYDASTWTVSKWEQHFEQAELYDTNKDLKQKVALLEWQLQLLNGVAHENQILRELTGMYSKMVSQPVFATRLAYRYQGIETAGSWLTIPESLQKTILSSNRKLENPNGPSIGVLGRHGLAGRIVQLSGPFGRFLPIDSEDSRFDVSVGMTHGVLVGGGAHKPAQLTLVPKSHTPVTGTVVYTGGRDSLVPAGIPVGVVEKVETSEKMYDMIEVRLYESSPAFREGWLIAYDF
jgi:cell shape-determining protein MreC